jgi:hypothetical protein
MYGCDQDCPTGSLIVDHGEKLQEDVWDFIRHATMGLALATGPHPFDNDVSKILNYLRGGLPVLSEEPIINNELVRRTGFGGTFAYNSVDDLVAQALKLLENPLTENKEWVMGFMAREHSWDRRVETYKTLFEHIAATAG